MHLYYLNKNSHKNPHLQSAWNKYGKRNFEFHMIEKCEEDKCIITEQNQLNIARTEQDKCYNLSFIAERIEMTAEVKHKIGKANSKRIWSSESLRKLRNIHIGRKHSQESIDKIRFANTGVVFSDERKSKIVRRNNNIYTIINKELNIKWEGTMYSIQEKLNVSRRTISAFVHKHYKSCRGWILLN